MANTKVITHELIDDAGGKVALDAGQIKVAADLPDGQITIRLRTTVVMEYTRTITVADGQILPAPGYSFLSGVGPDGTRIVLRGAIAPGVYRKIQGKI